MFKFLKINSLIIMITLVFFIISCNQRKKDDDDKETKTIRRVVVTPSGDDGGNNDSGTTDGSNINNSGNYTPTNSTCYGDQNDGVVRPGEDPALFSDLFYTNSAFKLPGEAPFFPGMTNADVSWMANLPNSLSYVQNNVTFNHTNGRVNPWPVGLGLDTVAEVFRSDSILRVRFKIENEPVPQTHTDEACWNRAIQTQLPHTKVQFDVLLRNVICTNPAITTPTTTMAECGYTNGVPNVELSEPYGFFQIDPTNTGSCSNIINIATPALDHRDLSRGTGPGKTYIATTIHIDNVKTDGACINVGGNSSTYCPVSTLSRGRCYSFNLQVVRDSTKDFQ